MDSTEISLELRKKRLVHRSRYRGFLEIDIILKHVTDKILPELDEQETSQYETLLEEADHDIYGWILKNRAVPPEHDHALMARLQALDFMAV